MTGRGMETRCDSTLRHKPIFSKGGEFNPVSMFHDFRF
jgi:hypothetical protein